MKTRIIRWYDGVLVALLGLLGINCSSNNDELMCEYGTPSMKFQMKGTVTDEAGAPLKGIKVKIIENYEDDGFTNQLDSTLTTASGEYSTGVVNLIGVTARTKLVMEDIDGEDNGGAFQNDTLNIKDFPNVKVEEGSHWYSGKYHYTGNVKLKRK